MLMPTRGRSNSCAAGISEAFQNFPHKFPNSVTKFLNHFHGFKWSKQCGRARTDIHHRTSFFRLHLDLLLNCSYNYSNKRTNTPFPKELP